MPIRTTKIILEINMDSNPSARTSSSITLSISAVDVDLAMSSDVGCLYKYTASTASPGVTSCTLSFRRYDTVKVNKLTDLPPQWSSS